MRPLDYACQFEAHRALAVCTDLGAIAPFEVRSREGDPDGLLWSDLQVGPGENCVRRLGSGRSGVLAGKYLKGVGRTSLAGNWNDTRDTYHGTGHLLPSAAVRERLVTVYMEARGAGASIVPCEGVLVRRADPGLVEGLDRLARSLETELAPADRRMQAITVKPADFARFSNLGWLVDASGPSASGIASLAYLMATFSEAPERPAPSPGACTPSRVAELVDGAVRRGLEAFGEYVRCGVYWGSFYNNFSLDGRFLDLEVAAVYGAPTVGTLVLHCEDDGGAFEPGTPSCPWGARCSSTASTSCARSSSCAAGLRAYAGMVTDPRHARFARELDEQLGSAFGPEHPVCSEERMVDSVVAGLSAAGADPEAVRPFVLDEFAEIFRNAERPMRTPRLVRRPGRAARPEPMRFASLYRAPELMREVRAEAPDACSEVMQHWLARLDDCVDPDVLLATLTEAEQAVREVACGSGEVPRATEVGVKAC